MHHNFIYLLHTTDCMQYWAALFVFLNATEEDYWRVFEMFGNCSEGQGLRINYMIMIITYTHSLHDLFIIRKPAWTSVICTMCIVNGVSWSRWKWKSGSHQGLNPGPRARIAKALTTELQSPGAHQFLQSSICLCRYWILSSCMVVHQWYVTAQ